MLILCPAPDLRRGASGYTRKAKSESFDALASRGIMEGLLGLHLAENEPILVAVVFRELLAQTGIVHAARRLLVGPRLVLFRAPFFRPGFR